MTAIPYPGPCYIALTNRHLCHYITFTWTHLSQFGYYYFTIFLLVKGSHIFGSLLLNMELMPSHKQKNLAPVLLDTSKTVSALQREKKS